MAYDDFTIEAVKRQFGLGTDEKGDYFASAAPVPLSETLRRHLDNYQRLALSIGTEKARSELLIMPVLLEVYERFNKGFSLFSGVDFNVDADQGLRGVCDFLLSLSPEQLVVEAPVVAIVEAKNENIHRGIGQCLAEMVAAQKFNQALNNPIETVYGVVTTRTNWKFLRLIGTNVLIDATEYHLIQADRIIGILLAMLTEATKGTA